MTTLNSVRQDIANILDYLIISELAIAINPFRETSERITFPVGSPELPLFSSREPPTVEQYVNWVERNAYTAALFDGGLVQVTYEVKDRLVVGHRLAYIPCPFDVDQQLIRNEALSDVVTLYRGGSEPILRSSVRFDFDPKSAKHGHPASHLTFNSVDCRIPCIAAVHPLRFFDFIFRHFYPKLWEAHRVFFEPGSRRHFHRGEISETDSDSLHLMWNQATALRKISRHV